MYWLLYSIINDNKEWNSNHNIARGFNMSICIQFPASASLSSARKIN